MSQRDDASGDEQDEETTVSDEIDTDRSTDPDVGDEDDGTPTSDESDAGDGGETDVSGTEDEGDQEASEGAEETEEADVAEDTERMDGAEEAGETDDVGEADPATIGEPETDESSSIGDSSGGVVESEVGGSGAAEADASSSAPEKGLDEVYCQSCGEPIKAEAEVCPHCGVRQSGSSSEEKSSAVSFIASLIIPGAGQAYNGQIGRAIAMFFGAIVADMILVIVGTLLSVILIGVFFFLLIPVVHVAIAYDAYNQAEKINRGEVTV
ncbi:zinc ribbon domain-containing protein [Salinigranum sp. GCM10025319]|uniref:zinc ribbon domain-containing protein n=1 Tax=Salinigranum sp. GCM10025319 TaxID=3252687 RepID=UPI003610BBCB